MKVILINPPSASYRKPEEHLGLAYLSSYIQRVNFDCNIIDAYLQNFSVGDVMDILKKADVDFVGISPYIDSMDTALEISEECRKPIVWGGHLATFSAEELLARYSFIDFVVRGEGELTFTELLRKFSTESFNFNSILGLAYREHSGKIKLNKPRPLISNLDSLPFPSRDSTKRAVSQGSMVHISASRGCPGNCSFCSINSLYRMSNGKTWRGRSPENVVKEIKTLRMLGFRDFKLVDDSFFGPEKNWKTRAFKFERCVEEAGLDDVRLRISVRANHVEKDVFKALKNAKVYAVSCGIESGCQRQLNTFKKGTTVEINKRALSILNELGIQTLMGFIGFDPYSTMAELKENLDFLKDIAEFCLSDIISKPLFVHAGDPITFQLLEEGLIKGRDYPNYKWKMKDSQAKRVYEHLVAWNGFSKELFYRTSEPLTAPRIIFKKDEARLLDLHLQMRKKDIEAYELVWSLIEERYSDEEVESALDDLYKKNLSFWESVSLELERLGL